MVEEYEEIILNFNNEKGNSVHAVYSFIKGRRPLVIITPQYEKTIKNNLIPMLYFINNGFNVLRYDNTFHKGNSYGDFEQFTFGSSMDDLEAVSKFIKKDGRINSGNGIALLGISISSRTAFKYLSRHTTLYDIFLSLVGVVDMQFTLKSITTIDLVQETINNPGIKWGIRKVIKYDIDYDNFLKNCIEENFHNLESTRKDVSNIRTDTCLIAAERDPWINFYDYDTVFKDNKAILKDVYRIPGADHLLYKNPDAIQKAMFKSVKFLCKTFYRQEIPDDEIKSPSMYEVLKLNRLEHQRQKESVLVNVR
ncbi:MAG: hypothetical protein JXB88_10240 [Spirochaetales bacterium]|nr:hypothetical protein [Spirochaetales bacterium]